MQSILIHNGFNLAWPDEVLEECLKLPDEITAEEIANRRDFRGITTFTIDPVTAKDFDDALSIRTLENGHTEVGVHIADVSHYVKPGTAIDKEALFRSTSVYLVDRVCPMLPEKLSNELCSLRPHEESLCYSAVFEIDETTK
ncbi:MAG: RNB domain-containing ribonuclease [Saprospiraceae bacterium]|nr:RNB domain-containing ribonuclease [Candidatus Opimibacter skivensis]